MMQVMLPAELPLGAKAMYTEFAELFHRMPPIRLLFAGAIRTDVVVITGDIIIAADLANRSEYAMV